MVNYRKILEHHFNGMTQRTIEVAIGSSRNTIRDIVRKAEEKEINQLSFEERFNLLIDYEYACRQSNKLQRLMRQSAVNAKLE